jgi:transposase-like protein
MNNYPLCFPYTKLHHTWTHVEHMQMNYDNFLNIKYNSNDKIKNFSTITSMRSHTPLCNQRINFITKFCKKYPKILNVYGSKWDHLYHFYNKVLPKLVH